MRRIWPCPSHRTSFARARPQEPRWSWLRRLHRIRWSWSAGGGHWLTNWWFPCPDKCSGRSLDCWLAHRLTGCFLKRCSGLSGSRHIACLEMNIHLVIKMVNIGHIGKFGKNGKLGHIGKKFFTSLTNTQLLAYLRDPGRKLVNTTKHSYSYKDVARRTYHMHKVAHPLANYQSVFGSSAPVRSY